jgi:metal-dependent amidase/aminoacylase/carboxypeptidase family protein
MPEQSFDEEKFTGEIRKFLKKVGITSQIEMENAARAALAAGTLDASQPLRAVMVRS